MDNPDYRPISKWGLPAAPPETNEEAMSTEQYLSRLKRRRNTMIDMTMERAGMGRSNATVPCWRSTTGCAVKDRR